MKIIIGINATRTTRTFSRQRGVQAFTAREAEWRRLSSLLSLAFTLVCDTHTAMLRLVSLIHIYYYVPMYVLCVAKVFVKVSHWNPITLFMFEGLMGDAALTIYIIVYARSNDNKID